MAVLLFSSGARIWAATGVTGASGGSSVSADSAGNAPTPAWTTLGAITISEGANDDFGVGSDVTLVLKAPAGFEFNTAVSPSVTFTPARDISSAAVAMTDASTITLTFTVSGTAAADSLTLGSTTGLQVRPTAGTPLATGKHIYRPGAGGGTANLAGITASADGSSGSNFGNLTEVVGAGTRLTIATQPSATAVVHALFAQQPVVRIEDQFGNLRNTDTWNVTAARNGGDGELEGTTSVSAVGGVATFTDMANSAVGDITITFFSVPWLEIATSQTISVGPGPFSKLQVLLPGETAAPGGAPGKTGSPSQQATGVGYTVTVNAVDADYNLIATNDTVHITSSDASAGLPPNAALSGGTMTFTVTNRTVGNWTITASDVTHPGIAADTSSTLTVATGEFVKLQVLMPGETAAPGTPSGKTGTPTVRTAGTSYSVTVNAVDGNWNVVNVSDTVQVTCTDPNASLPANAALSGGTGSFTVANKTAGSWTITASDVTQPAIVAGTSPSFTVNPGTFTKLQLLVPGESAAPGTSTGKTGTPTAQNTDNSFNVTVNAVDANWNVVPGAGDTVSVSSSDPNATLPANAALSGGSQSFSLRMRTVGSRTVTATDVSDGSKTANTSPAITVNLGAFAQLQVLLPGETAAPGTATGKTGSPSAQAAGASFNVTVRAVDANYNLISTNDTVQITSSDANAVLPANAALSVGTGSFSVVNKTAGSWTVTASDVTHGSITAGVSASFAVNPGAFTKLQLLVPGETAAPGSATGKTGTPMVQNTDSPFTVTANAVDANWNLVPAAADTVAISSSDANANLPANAALSGGTRTFSVRFRTAGSRTVTATDVTDGGKTANTSPAISVNLGAFARLQVLLPGETAAPGTATGKTGSPSAQTAGTGYTVTVNAVDANYNPVSTNDTVQITSSDANVVLPANAALIGGTGTFSLTNKTAGTWTVTASDVTQVGITASTSTSFTVNPGAFTKLQLLVPGESAAPGTTTGKTGTATAQNTDSPFNVIANAVDANWNVVPAIGDTVAITASDANAALPANAALSGGTRTFSVRFRTAGSGTVTATDVTDGSKAASTSSTIPVSLGGFAQLQILLPGETAAPGTPTGKTGFPIPQTAGAGYTVSVNAVDANYNLISTNDTVHFTSSDANATLPANGALSGGTGTFTITNKITGNQTLTVSDVTHAGIGAATSAAVVVQPAVATQLVIGVAPAASATARVPFAPQPVILIEDAYGNVRSNDTLVVTATRNAGTGTLLGTTNVTAVGGVATFTDLAHSYANNISIQFSSGSLTPVNSGTIAVGPGPFSQLQVLLPGETAAPGSAPGKTGSPTAQATGTGYSLTVRAVDADYNLVNTNDLVHLASSDSTAILPADGALSGGTTVVTVTNRTVGSWTFTASNVTHPGIAPNTSSAVAVGVGAFVKLQVLLPGETAAPGTTSGKTGSPTAQTAGSAYTVTVNAVDDNWNLISVSDAVQITSSDANASLPANAALIGGTQTFSLTNKTAGNWTVTASDVTQPSIAVNVSTSFTVNPGAFTKLQLLAPGETASPGTATGKSGTPAAQNTDSPFNVTANAVDANWNVVPAIGDTVAITASDLNATLPANAGLTAGTGIFSVKLNTTGNWTVTATDVTDGSKTASTSSAISVGLGAFAQLQILVPGETAAPGTPTGKTGTPAIQTAGAGYTVIVNAVDAKYNLINTNDTVQVTSTDATAGLPANAALIGGTTAFSVTNKTAGAWTVTASDVTHPAIVSATSAAVTIQPAAASQLAIAVAPPTAATARVPFAPQPVILIEDAFGNVRSNDTPVVTATRSAGAGTLLGTTSVTAAGGIATFSDLAHSYATNITIQFSSGSLTSVISSAITVAPGPFSQLQVLLPGETATPSVAPGKAGSPIGQAADTGYTIRVNAVDADYNLINTNDTVHVISSDASAVLPADTALSSGTTTVMVTNRTVGSWTFTASDASHPDIAPDTSSAIAVGVGTFVKLQVLLPGESAAPGTSLGKTGTPTAQTAGTPYTVTVNAVDANYNLISTNDTVQITSTDTNAALPANAALIAGTGTFTVTNKTAGNWTLTVSDVTQPVITPSTSTSFLVASGAFAKLQLLVPGETTAPGTATGKTGTPTAQNTDTPFNVTANAVDDNWNLVSAVGDTVAITASDPNALLPASAALSGGTGSFSVKLNTAGNWTMTATDVTDGSKMPHTSSSVAVNLGAFVQLQILLPGETAAPGTLTGKTGTPTAQIAGTGYTVTVKAVDARYNLINTNDTVQVSSSDVNATLPANTALTGGTATLSLTNKTAGNWTVTAADATQAGITASTSSAFAVNPGAFAKLQLLVPGETAMPGTTTGKTGTPTTQIPDTAFNVTANAVDANWNLVNTVGDTVAITSSDPNATLPVDAALSGGTGSFSVKLNTAGSWTVTATDVSDGSKTPSTSSAIPVNLGTFTRLQILMPGETAAPGTVTGKTGTPTPQIAGTAYPVTVNAVDVKYNLVNTNDVVHITSSDTNAVLPADTALSGGTATFSVTNTTAGNQTVTASDASQPGISSDTGTVAVNPAVASKLAFTSIPVTVVAGVASAAITVQRQDQYGNPVTNESVRTVTLSSTSTGTVVFNPPALSITNGSSSAEFTYTDTRAATPTITAESSLPSSIASATQQETVSRATPIFSGLAPSQSIIYGATAITLAGKVSAPGGVYPAVGEAVAVSINGNSQSATISNSTGDFSFTYAPATIPASATAYTIAYSFGGDTNLSAALDDISTTLTVNKAALTVAANNASRTYGQSNPVFTAVFTGWVNGENTNVLGGTLTLSTPAETNSPVGSYPIIPGGLTSTNYALTLSNGTMTVTAASLSVAANNVSRSFGATNPVFSGIITGVQNGDDITATYNTTATEESPMGDYPITPTLADPAGKLGNYLVGLTNGTLTVTAPAAPVILSIVRSPDDDSATITWTSVKSAMYRVQYKTSLGSTTWLNLAPEVTATNITASFTDQQGAAPERYYRIAFVNTATQLAPLVVAINDASRIYGATNPVFSGTITGLQSGDNITATYGTTATAMSSVGTYSILPQLADPEGKLGNYAVSILYGTLTVQPAALSVTVNSASRAYGTTNPIFSGAVTGLLNGDPITTTYISTATQSSNVGTYPITPVFGDSYRKLSNYTLSITNGTLTVTPAQLAVAAGNASRAYGDTNPAFSGTITGVRNGDTITAVYATTATLLSTVGTYPVAPTLVDPGSKLGNYTVNSTNGTLSVTPAALTVAGNNVSRAYGTTNPVFSGMIMGIKNGDDISATYASTATITSPIGPYPITPTLADPGSKLANYSVNVTNGTLSVTAASLTVAANNASRVYGATNPAFSGTITGIRNGDNISATYASAASITSSVGNYPIIPTLVDPDSRLANYAVSSSNGTLNVTTASLSVVVSNAFRTYGATNPVFSGTISGILNADNITATYSSTAAAASSVGAYPITPTLADPDNKLGNYFVNSSNGTLTVTAAALGVAANNASRSYGTTNPAFSGTITGILNADNITATYVSPATVTSPIGAYAIIPSLVDPDSKLLNYVVTTNGATLTITPAALTVTADPQSKLYGQTDPSLTYHPTSGVLFNGDSLSGSLSRVAGENAGIYAILQGTLGASSNYVLSYVGSQLTIAPTWLLAQADSQSRAYGATNPILTISYGGFIGTDGVTNLTVLPQASTSAQTNSPAGHYAITVTGGSASNYSIVPLDGELTVTPAALTVTANSVSRALGTTNPILTGTITGIRNGDNITATYATTATLSSPIGAYPIVPTLTDPGNKLPNYAVGISNGTLTVTAPAQPVITSIVRSAGNAVTVTWTAISNSVYRVQYKTSLASASWFNLAPDVTATGDTASFIDHPDSGSLRFYRVMFLSGATPLIPLTVTVNSTSRVYGATNPVFSGTIAGVQGGDNITATYTTTATAGSPVGMYPITPTLVDPNGKLDKYLVTMTNGTLTVTAANLSVAANNVSRAYGATNPVFSGTITGIQNGDSITATYSCAATAASPVGTYPITATLIDPSGKLSNYSAITNVGTLTVNPLALTATADPQSKAYGQPDPPLTYQLTSGVLLNGDTITGALSRVAGENAGFYSIVQGTLTATTNYVLSFIGNQLTVTPTWLTAKANDLTRPYGVTNPVLTITYSGFVGTDGITNLSALPQATTSAQTNSPLGQYGITVTGGNASNYFILPVNGKLTVVAAPLTVVANNASRPYGATNPVFGGILSGIQNGDNITATYACGATTASSVGGYPIVPTLVDPAGRLSNYSVSATNGTLNVTTASLTASANNASRAYGATNPIFSGTLSGILNGDNITATYASSAGVTSPVGGYPIVPTLVDPSGKLSNYSVSASNGTLSVTAVALTVAANNTSRVYGATNPIFSGTITGIKNGDNITATYVSTATTNSPVGTYAITPTLVDPTGKGGNYSVSMTNGTLNVMAAALTVAANNASRAYGATNPVFSGTVSGIQNGDNITATYASAATVTSPVGGYPITPTLVDPTGKLGNYSVSTNIGTLSVTVAALSVAANNASRSYGATNPAFSGTINGIQNGDNITATYASTATVASPVGPYPITPTLVDPNGKLGNYSVSTTNGTLNVTAAALSVTANNAARGYGVTNPVFSGTVTGIKNGDNITATYASAATITSTVGAYPIIPSLADPSGKLGNYSVTTNNGTLSVTAAPLTVTANNASRAYGATNPVFSGTITGIRNGDNITATYASSATVASPVGTYPIVPTLVDPSNKLPNYTVTSSNGTLTVTASAPLISSIVSSPNNANVTITWNSISNSTYRVQYRDSLASASWFNLTPDVTATASTASFTDHPGAASLRFYRVVLLVGAPPLIPLGVTANNVSRAYGVTNPVLTGTITGLQGGDNITATYTTTATLNSTVGAYPITPTLVDPDGKLEKYAVTITSGSLTVTAAPLVVVANNASRIYGATNPVFSGTITGIRNGDNITATYASPATVASSVGSYSITPTLVDPSSKLGNYSVSSTNGALNVTVAALTVGANGASRVYGATNPVFSGTISGIRNGDNITATYACAATPASLVGTYPITPTLVDPSSKLGNYSVTSSNGTLIVTAAPLTVTANDASRAYNTANPSFSGTITGIKNGDNITATYACAATAASPVGMYPIVPTLVDPNSKLGNYNATIVNGTLTVVESGVLFLDEFSQGTAPSSPWVVQSGTWAISGGELNGGPNPAQSYGYLYNGSNWTNYSVEARVQLPVGAYGGGVGGRLNPATGAHYAAWIFPENSLGGSNVLKLIKFQNWTTFEFGGAAFEPMVQVRVAAVGTNWHALKLSLQGNLITVSFDGNELISVTDTEALPYTSGGASVDFWTSDTPYLMRVDDFLVTALSSVQTPSTLGITRNGNGTATVTFAGTPGAQYIVQTATNLTVPTAWVNASTNTAGADGKWTFTDSTTSGARRFYRSAKP